MFLWKFSFFPEALYQGLVAEAIEELLALFPAEQILFLQYERCKADTEQELQRTYSFLGIDPNHKTEDASRRVNTRTKHLSPLEKSERKRLASFFQKDVERTFSLVPGLERTLWKDFETLP